MVKPTNPTLVGIFIQYQVIIEEILSPISHKVTFWAWLEKGIFTLIEFFTLGYNGRNLLLL